jgi:hypothetical protein
MLKQSLILIDYIKKLGTTVLHCAPEKKEVLAKVITAEMAELISRADISLASIDAEGKTALMHAVELGNFIVVDYLCKWNVISFSPNYPDIHAVSHAGISALGYGVRYNDISDNNESKQEEKTIDALATPISRQRFIVQRLLYNKANYIAWDVAKQDPKSTSTSTGEVKEDSKVIKTHVLGLASAAGNHRFIQQYCKDAASRLSSKDFFDYFLPQAIAGGLPIFKCWLNIKLFNVKNYESISEEATRFLNYAVAINDVEIIAVLIGRLKHVYALPWPGSQLLVPGTLLTLIDPGTIQAVLACSGTDMLKSMLAYGYSNCVTKDQGYVTNPLPTKVSLHAAYLLQLVASDGDLEKVKLVVDLAIKARINAEDIAGRRIETAFALACQKGYIEVVKEILRLKPSIYDCDKNILPMPPVKFIEKHKKTRENERVAFFLSAYAQITRKEGFIGKRLAFVHTDDLKCLPSYFDFDYNKQEELEDSVQREFDQRPKAKEVKQTNTSLRMPSAPELKHESSSQAIQSVSFGDNTTLPTAPQQEGIPSVLSSNSNIYPAVMSFSPESLAHIPPPAYAASSEIIPSNHDVFSVVKNSPQPVMLTAMATQEGSAQQNINILTSPLANNVIIPVATAPELQAAQVIEINMEQNPDEEKSVQHKLSSPRHKLSLFQAAPVQSADEKQKEHLFYMLDLGLQELANLKLKNPSIAQAIDDGIQARLEERKPQLRNNRRNDAE